MFLQHQIHLEWLMTQAQAAGGVKEVENRYFFLTVYFFSLIVSGLRSRIVISLTSHFHTAYCRAEAEHVAVWLVTERRRH